MRDKGKVKELFAAMSTAEKAKYIWEYYRYYLFAFVIVLIVTIFLVNDYSPKKDSALSILVLGDLVDSNEIKNIQQRLNEGILSEEERKKQEVSIQVIPYAPDAADLNVVMAALQRVTGEISTGELDVLFIDKEQFEIMNGEQYFYNLDKLIDKELQVDKEFLYFDSENQATGIDAQAMPLFNEAIDDPNVVMGVIVNTQRTENIEKLLKILF